MKKLVPLSIITTTLLTFSGLTHAAHHNHKPYHNYKGEIASRTVSNYKDERMVPMPEPCGGDPGMMDGFYVGAQGGYDIYRIRQTINDGAGDSFNPTLSPTGLAGGFFIGFGQFFNEIFYFGTEITGNFSGARASWAAITPTESFHSTTKGQGDVGIHFRPGIKLNNYTLGYLRVGYNRARFYTQEYGNIDGVAFSTKKSAWKGGWAAGIGMEATLYQNWGIRGEYTYARYQSLNNNLSGSKYTPSDNQVMIGILYHFA